MGLLDRIRARRERKAYERNVLWRQENTPYGEMLAQTLAYQRKFETKVKPNPGRTEALQQLRERVRAAFLSHPAATEADFERCWPVLRDEIFMRHARRVLETEGAA